ncbi:hypothetical protein E3N88_38194 [Mikania micrantha]|uniref:Uncharacterized protein n=1 Tax=Mikania micrantha TaxID=192012 RepID=A0A5N6LTB9_9ASTR|nr:hypothetical protein E3N88_38194 [Mikania micrantha]
MASDEASPPLHHSPSTLLDNFGHTTALLTAKSHIAPVEFWRACSEETYSAIEECVENGLATIEYVAGKVQKADILTKALSRVKFLEMREVLGVEDLSEVKTEIKGVNLG